MTSCLDNRSIFVINYTRGADDKRGTFTIMIKDDSFWCLFDSLLDTEPDDYLDNLLKFIAARLMEKGITVG